MSGSQVTLAQVRQAVLNADDGAELRLRQSDQSVTTAKRGFGSRIVQFFTGSDRTETREIGRSVLQGLRQEFAPSIGTEAFRLARGEGGRRDGVAFDASKPITARQVRDAIAYAQVLTAKERSNVAAEGAMRYAPESSGFAKIAAAAKVDPAALSPAQKEHYKLALAQHVKQAAQSLGPDAMPMPGADVRRLAAKTLAHVARMDPPELRSVREAMHEKREAGAALARSLGNPDTKPAALAANLLRFHSAATAHAEQAALASDNFALGADDYDKSLAMSLDLAMSALSHREARELARAAMQPGGAGRALLFAAAVNAAATSAIANANGSVAANALDQSAGAMLQALGRRGGLDIHHELDAVRDLGYDAGDRIRTRQRGKGGVTGAEARGAGLDGGSAANALIGKTAQASGTLAGAMRVRQAEDAAAKVAFLAERQATSKANVDAARGVLLSDDGLSRALNAFEVGHRPAPSAAALREIRAIVMDEVHRQARAELRVAGPLVKLDGPGADAAVVRAIAAKAEALEAVYARPASDFDRLDGTLVSPRLASALTRTADIAARRMEARLYASSGGGAAFEQEVMREIAAELGALPNAALLDHYRTLLSPDMLELRIKLATDEHSLAAQAALGDLNTWEALVQTELSERSLLATDAVAGPQDGTTLTGRQAGTIAHVELRAQKRELGWQSDEYLRGDQGAVRSDSPTALTAAQRTGLPLAAISKLVREADLTINLPGRLFEPGEAFFDADGQVIPGQARLQNIFQRPSNEKGDLYVERRRLVEHTEMPTLAKLDAAGFDPADHPISAALNPGRNLHGGGFAGGYGDCFLVLKDQVKQSRATYTPQDSFYSYSARLTDTNVAEFKHELITLIAEARPTQMGADDWDRLGDLEALQTLFSRLNDAVGESFGIGSPRQVDDWVADTLTANLPALAGQPQELLLNLAVKHFGDRSDVGSHVTSFERLTHVLAETEDSPKGSLLGGVAVAASDPLRVNTTQGSYIEAQIFGGVDLTRDVKEIRVNSDTISPEAMRALTQFTTDHGITLGSFEMRDRDTTRLGTDESIVSDFDTEPPGAGGKMVKSLAEFRDSGRLEKVLDTYATHEQSFDPTGIHGRRHIARAMIYANVMANIVREAGGKVNPDVLYTAVGLHDAGREGNGPDRWEAESAAAAKAIYTDMGVTDMQFLKQVGACIDSKAPASQRSIEGAILKSADSLDIMRVVGKDGYDPDLLWFMNRDTRIGPDTYLVADPTLRDELMAEVARFIEETEPVTRSEPTLEKLQARFTAVTNAMADHGAALARDGAAPSGERSLDDLMDEQVSLNDQLRDLRLTVADEHRELNAGQSSIDVFGQLERHLKENSKTFPLLDRYYQTAT